MKNKLFSLKSYKAMNEILNGYVLEDFQCVDVLMSLLVKKNVVMYDTGMGKTLVASAIMKMLTNEVSSRRFLMLVEKSQLIQTPRIIREATGLNVLTVTAEFEQIEGKLLMNDFMRYQVVMITHDTLNNPYVMGILLKNRKAFTGVIVDEAHKLSNFKTSSSGYMLRSLLRNFEYAIALTATPITTAKEQLANLAHVIDMKRFRDPDEITRQMEYDYDLIGSNKDFFLNRTRADLGIISNYRPHIVMTEPMHHQIGASGINLMSVTKGEGAVNQALKLVEMILQNRPQRGLVYINQHSVRKWVIPHLESAGVLFESINGKTPLKKRGEIQEKFNNKQLDIVITSVTTSLDLDCDYVVFYEFTTDIKQMMGRAERGLNPKTLDLYFIFTRRTGEIDYFITYIYNRSLSIQEVLKKDYSMLIKAGEMLTEELTKF